MHWLSPALPRPCFTSRQPGAPRWGKRPAAAQSVVLRASSSSAPWYTLQNDTLCLPHFMRQCWFSAHTERGYCREIPYFFNQFHTWGRKTFAVNFKYLPLSYTVSGNWWPPVTPVPVWIPQQQTFWGTILPQPPGPISSCIWVEARHKEPLLCSAVFRGRNVLFFPQVFGQTPATGPPFLWPLWWLRTSPHKRQQRPGN